MGSFILALDQGTTSSRAILFDRSGRVAAMAQQTFPQHYPQPGWVEHDPLELWESQRSVAAQAVHTFFQDRGFVYVQTPIITLSLIHI